MKKFIFTLIFILTVSIEGYSQTITLTPIGTQDVSGIPISVSHIIPGATIGTITQLTTTIPADRGQASNVIWSSANSDQGNVVITHPTGYEPKVGSTSYTQSTLHANAWLSFGTTSYNSFASWATAPNVPTLHFTSVNNGSTDNNMSHASWETYTDTHWGDVYRIRYEGSYKYNVQGINTKIDIYFIKNDLSKYIVVLRQFLADGSNQEQIGVSNGVSWLAHNIISSTSFSTGQAWLIETQTTVGSNTPIGTLNTNSNGQVTFNNPNNYQYEVTIDVSQKFHLLNNETLNYMMYKKANLSPITDWDFYTLDLNNSTIFGWEDIIWGYSLVQNGVYHNKYIFTQSEKTTIESNPNTNYYNTYFPNQLRTIENQNQFYIMGTGIPKSTTQMQTIQ
jgi:hypothetical protein